MPKPIFLEAGKIVGTHGVRGEVRVRPECDSPAMFCTLRTVYFDDAGKRAVRMKARVHKNIALAKLDGVDTVEAAAALRGTLLYLNRRDVKLEHGRYFICDLIGAQVIDHETGSVYGECTDVTHTGSNDVYHMKTPSGKEILIPAIPDVIREIDVEHEIIRIFPMLGLFDDEN
ncbi:MAG: 16S rRNA processing protein RimM [Clostridia bacterium]|nr:16S rRNA processing protein RimM [Clostridia bacterium]